MVSCGRGWQRANLHPPDQTPLQGEAVSDLLVGQHGATQIPHDVVHFYQDVPGGLRVKSDRFHVRVDLAPLLTPVGAHGCRSLDTATLDGAGPLHVGGHEGERGGNVARVEGRVSGSEQFSL